MPIGGGGIFSGNSTAQTTASGKVLPVAAPAGVTVDTTTYADPISGIGKLVTLIFPTEQALIAVAQSGDAHPRYILSSDASDTGISIGNGTIDPVTQGGSMYYSGSGVQLGRLDSAGGVNQPPRIDQVSPLFTITSGALPTHDFTGHSGTGQQISLTRDVDIYVETGTAGSVVAALSPDDMTYTTIYTKTVALTDVCHARVPAGWYLKLTATTAVLGVGTYA